MKRKFLIAGLVLAAIALLGWLYINKSHRSAAGQPDITVSASILFDSFATDELSANKKYLNRLLEVRGVVGEHRQDQDHHDVIILRTNDPMFGVSCSFSSPLEKVTVGDSIKVKGFCTGYLSDVVLVRCVKD